MAHVTYPEKAFLLLVARRVLRYSREAAERGEKYNDLSGFSPLQCGVRVRVHLAEAPGGYIPVVGIRPGPSFSASELKEIAAEILDGPAKLRLDGGGDLEYVRETDAG